MCGRYTVTKNREKIEEFFNIKDSDFLYSEIFNAYPSQELPIIVSDLAFISLFEIEASLDQNGIRPHLKKLILFFASIRRKCKYFLNIA